MPANHFEILVEEPSMEAFLREVVPLAISPEVTFEIYTHQGKTDLIARLEERLRGYSSWLPDDWRIVVVVDRDDDNCVELKQNLEAFALSSGMRTPTTHGVEWNTAFRISIEELESWYFGEWKAVTTAYPKASPSVPRRAAYRICDDIAGGTWEAFEREMQNFGYFKGGLRKIEAARDIGKCFSPELCSSRAFNIYTL